jgi:hypothetical protein
LPLLTRSRILDDKLLYPNETISKYYPILNTHSYFDQSELQDEKALNPMGDSEPTELLGIERSTVNNFINQLSRRGVVAKIVLIASVPYLVRSYSVWKKGGRFVS